jgi:hypothetical protein
VDHKTAPWYQIVRNSLWATFKADVYRLAILSFFGEFFAIFYTYFIGYLIMYIKDDDAPWQEGAIYAGIFITATLLSTILRNQ